MEDEEFVQSRGRHICRPVFSSILEKQLLRPPPHLKTTMSSAPSSAAAPDEAMGGQEQLSRVSAEQFFELHELDFYLADALGALETQSFDGPLENGASDSDGTANAPRAIGSAPQNAVGGSAGGGGSASLGGVSSSSGASSSSVEAPGGGRNSAAGVVPTTMVFVGAGSSSVLGTKAVEGPADHVSAALARAGGGGTGPDPGEILLSKQLIFLSDHLLRIYSGLHCEQQPYEYISATFLNRRTFVRKVKNKLFRRIAGPHTSADHHDAAALRGVVPDCPRASSADEYGGSGGDEGASYFSGSGGGSLEGGDPERSIALTLGDFTSLLQTECPDFAKSPWEDWLSLVLTALPLNSAGNDRRDGAGNDADLVQTPKGLGEDKFITEIPREAFPAKGAALEAWRHSAGESNEQETMGSE